MNPPGTPFSWIVRSISLYVLFIVFFIAGIMAVGSAMPANTPSEPGLVPATTGLLIIALVNLLVIVCLILASRWSGWRLAITLALAYYGVATLLNQIESWYFLSSITVGPELLPRLFLMGLPTAFLFIPLAVWLLGKGRPAADPSPHPPSAMPVGQWAWKLAALVVVYLLLYFGAGYFIAWQNPDLRAFYGQPGEPLPFFAHVADTLRRDPGLLLLQVFRALLWTLCALPIILSSRLNAWWTALLVGLFFSLPQNVGHIIANPLMPVASVRLSHMIETASSTFIFGAVVVWLLHREHHDAGDLIGITGDHKEG